MRIVIDLQAAQTPQSRSRGIGRYSIALAKAMLRQRGDHEILLMLNGMFEDTIEPLRRTFEGLLRPRDIRVWHAAVPALPADSLAQRQAAERVREAFLASLQPDVVHVASMFEHSPLAVTAAGAADRSWHTAVTLYDLIPHVYADIYLPGEAARRNYTEKLDHLRAADLWLAISEASRVEGIERLALSPDRVVNISSAADPHFTPGVPAAERESALRQRYGLAHPFVMYTGGIDHRKNIEGLIEAWAQLPQDVRRQHQLAVVCSVQPLERDRLERQARQAGLPEGQFVLTGFVPEEDLVDLYRLCKLFVFPSRHEGFGLPALEAMSCGAPVIGANNSSIPEVVGRADALFDASSPAAMAEMILAYLQDADRREALARHGLEHARRFNWDRSAQAALQAFERIAAAPRRAAAAPAGPRARPRLAYVSPMPPEHTGIADYSAELLPALAAHYQIDLVLDQESLSPLPEGTVAARRSAQWFMEHGHEYDRVLYHVGNSAFHLHMLALMRRHPGTVVLHDFYLSGLMAHAELDAGRGPVWTRALYDSHGWHAVAHRFRASRMEEVIYAHPCNIEVLQNAIGVIVHSPYSVELARQWYGAGAARGWAHIPHLRVPLEADRDAARKALGLSPEDFLVCSFGLLGPTKLNDRLLRAWRASPLARDPRCHLVFVGENHPGDYGKAMAREVAACEGRVRISGWASTDDFRRYLAAADLAVQLRSLSRGETSGTVLDAMNHAIPIIANANGSMAHLPAEAVTLLDDEFTDDALVQALVALWQDPARRARMGAAGRSIIETRHSPAGCAAAYAGAIEGFVAQRARGEPGLVRDLGSILAHEADDARLAALASAIAQNLPQLRPARQVAVDVSSLVTAAGGPEPLPKLLLDMIERPLPGWRLEPVWQREPGQWFYARRYVLSQLGCPPQALPDERLDLQPGDLWCGWTEDSPVPQRVTELALTRLRLGHDADAQRVWSVLRAAADPAGQRRWFLDISELVRRDWKSGIQRVVKNYLLELMSDPPPDVQIVPVWASNSAPGYRVAWHFLQGLCAPPQGTQPDDPEAALRLDPPAEPAAGDTLFMLDLQPVVAMAQADYLKQLRAAGVRVGFMVYDLLPLRLPDCFYPGAASGHENWLKVVAHADLAVCISQAVADDLQRWFRESLGLADEAQPRLRAVHLGADLMHSMPSRGLPPDAPSILEQIRRRPSFVMVGTLEPRKRHAAVLAAFEELWAQGQDVNLVVCGREGWMAHLVLDRMERHPERGRRLFWINDPSDEYLEQIYAACSCLILASRGEGFGLPLVEAAQRQLPVLARDLPVFREVAGDHAFYFRDDAPKPLAADLQAWLALFREGRHPRSEGMRWLSWQQSARQLKQVLLELQAQAPGRPPCSASTAA